MLETQEDQLKMERRQRYWRSLLSIKPTGNAMVDAGLHEEVRCALRDALHVIDDLSRQKRIFPCTKKNSNS